MGFRNQGPIVSQNPQPVSAGGGQYTAEDHNFESLVFQQGRAPCDWEMNLVQEALGTYGFRRHLQRLLPSCWVSGEFTESGSDVAGLTFLAPDTVSSTTANKFQVSGADVVVNGWMIRFDLTESATPGVNEITLPAPPTTLSRTDFVILEVWRQLISPSPTSTGKSASGQIFRFGNVKAPDLSPPGNQNLADDLLDPTLATETAKRVQIQYRYRVISGITSLTATPDGFDDPAVLARTVPFQSASGLDGAVTAYPYVQSTTDPGLWVAGNGDQVSATALGTEDGNMYAIPMFAVFRRNTGGFNRATNLNGGGVMSSATSGRPDGLYSNQIIASDIKDLRKSVAWDLTEVSNSTFQSLLDNSLPTEHEITQNASEIPFLGPGGTSFLVRDNIGTSSHAGNPDAVRINFSDRSVTESIVCKVPIVGATNTITLNLNNLPVWWHSSSVNLTAISPTGVNIVGVGQVRIVNSATFTDVDMMANPPPAVYVKNILLTATPGPYIDQAVLNFNTTTSNVDIFVELLIEYPLGSGVRRNVISSNQFWTPPALNIAGWVDGTILSATIDAVRKSLSSTYWWMDVGHREVSVRLKTIPQSKIFYSDSATTIRIPDILTGSVTIDDGSNPAYMTSAYTVNTSYTTVTLSFARPVGTSITTTYSGLRPIPPTAAVPGDSYQIFYQSRAIQSIPVPSGTQTLELVPRIISNQLHVMTSGSGSPDSPFPYVQPSAQISNGLLPSASYPEARLDTPCQISTIGFGVNTGYAQLPVMVPYTPNASQVQLFKDAPDTTIDGDSRNFWPKSNTPSPVIYSPSAWAASLSSKQKHKVAYPVLMELKSDFASIGRKGTLVLIVFSRWMEFDDQNSVSLTSSAGETGASVYRVRGNLMNPRRRSI